MNTNLVKAVQRAAGREQTGNLTDEDVAEIHRFLTGIRYVEPVGKKAKDSEPQKASLQNHGQESP